MSSRNIMWAPTALSSYRTVVFAFAFAVSILLLPLCRSAATATATAASTIAVSPVPASSASLLNGIKRSQHSSNPHSNPLLHPMGPHASKRCPDKEWDLRLRYHSEKARLFKSHNHHRFCNATDVCGVWGKGKEERFWIPRGCHYQDITPTMARKCLGNRTIAFVGDSQIRDTGFGVALFLAGAELKSSPSDKFDMHRHNINLTQIATKIEDFPHWKANVPAHNFNGYIFPETELAKENKWEYQIQAWNLFRNEFHQNNQLEDVLNNNMLKHNALLRPIDLAFWSHGLHDWGWWEKEPFGKHYYETMTNQWISKRKSLKVDTVWVSMNNECLEKLAFPFRDMKLQQRMVEDANDYVNSRLSDEDLPYWDAAAPLRSLERCEHMADGVHVKMYVDNMRAKMLFNHLCDKDMNWIGSSNRFL